MTSEETVQSIVSELLDRIGSSQEEMDPIGSTSKDLDRVGSEREDSTLPPHKKLKLAKAYQVAEIPQRGAPVDQTQSTAEFKVPYPKVMKNSPKYDVTRKLADLKAECGHWKRLWAASRFQVLVESRARLEMQQKLALSEQKLEECTEVFNQILRIFAETIWALSQSSNAVNASLKDKQLEDLMRLIYGTLDNFIQDVVKSDSGSQMSESETHLIVAITGCASNLAGSTDGLRFLLENPVGQDVSNSFQTLLLADLECLTTEVQVKVQRLILNFLFNITIHEKGITYLTSNPALVKKLDHLSKNPLFKHWKIANSICKRIGQTDSSEDRDIEP